MSFVIRVSNLISPGHVLLMPDYSHPETPMFEFDGGPGGLTARPAAVPDGRVLCCAPEDERAVRDAVALAQERPRWWEDLRAIERAISRGGTR